MLVLKRLLNFSPLSYASRTSVSKSKIHLYYKHFSVEELKTSQFVLNQGEKHRNTCLYSEHFQRRVRANWLVFNRIWVAVYCLLCFSFFVRSRYRCTSSLARKRNSAHFSTAYQRVEIYNLTFSTRWDEVKNASSYFFAKTAKLIPYFRTCWWWKITWFLGIIRATKLNMIFLERG